MGLGVWWWELEGRREELRLRFLGGTGEVGRSAILVEAGGARVLLDYGVMLDDEPGFPMHVPPREVDGIIIT
ncbi:hypothetical protein DRO32_03835, partial [Candidatus Bathyarchaeota archaeon]